MATKFYIQLPSNQTPMPKPGRRPPLTPSSVSPPSLTAHTCAARQEAGAESRVKATAMLSRVASHSSRSRRGTPTNSPPMSPAVDTRTAKSDTTDYWYHDKQQGGYISFPDFEAYSQSLESSTSSSGHSQYQDERT